MRSGLPIEKLLKVELPLVLPSIETVPAELVKPCAQGLPL
jgi:hypothetical protein